MELVRCTLCHPSCPTRIALVHEGAPLCRAHSERVRVRGLLSRPRPRPGPAIMDHLTLDAMQCILLFLERAELQRVRAVCRAWAGLGSRLLVQFPAPELVLSTRWDQTKKNVLLIDAEAQLKGATSYVWELEVRTGRCSQVSQGAVEGPLSLTWHLSADQYALPDATSALWVTCCVSAQGRTTSSVLEVRLPGRSSLLGQRTVRGGCFLGTTPLRLAQGGVILAQDLKEGTLLLCGDGKGRRVKQVRARPEAWWGATSFPLGVGLTRGHPVHVGSDWWRADEVATSTWGWHWGGRYNLVLHLEPEEVETALARTVWGVGPEGGLVCATLGTSCGRLAPLYPSHHEEYCKKVLAEEGRLTHIESVS